MWKIPLFKLGFDKLEISAVNDVLESKWLTMGEKTKEFEKNFAGHLGGAVYASAVSSGTAALHLALMLLDLKKGDEVILSGLSFVAALNVVTLSQGTPVLADSKSYHDWNVSTSDIIAKITPKTKALIIVHYAGYPCDMDEISAICKNHNIFLIEDAAHAVGATYKDKHCGTFGDIGCFSFFSNKNLSVGEGGMIVTGNPDLHQKINLLRSHGMNSMTIDRHLGRTISYDVLQPGLNYRLDEIRSALGIVQLSKLKQFNDRRGELVRHYINRLKDIQNILIPWQTIEKILKPAYHIFPILLSEETDREGIMRYLQESGIQTSIHYPAYNQFSHYEQIIKEKVTIANNISDRVLTLPLYPGLKTEEIDYISGCIEKYFTHAD